MATYKLEDVFGISRNLPLNYTTRSHVDDKLINSLNRKQHIVIYGSSKQGKTCLRKNSLSKNQYITVHCSNRLDILDLNQLILKSAGFEITGSQNQTISGITKAKATFGLATFAKLLGETELERVVENQISTEALELDLQDSNDIIRALESINFDKYIILDDFHYLKPNTQKDFAFSLKAFYENSNFCFIIVGVWLEKNRLIALNGDLAGRVIPVDAEDWSENDLKKVIKTGLEFLNVEFDLGLIDSIIEGSFDNVYLVQEICYRICLSFGIKETLSEPFFIGKTSITAGEEGINFSGKSLNLNSIVKEIIDQHSGRYNSFILQFSDGFQNSDVESYKWLLYPILYVNFEELITGLSFNRIKEIIKCSHPQGDKLNSSNLSLALKALTNLQLEKDITPNILDYDQTNLRLNVVDKEFIIWLSYQDKKDLFALAGFKDRGSNSSEALE